MKSCVISNNFLKSREVIIEAMEKKDFRMLKQNLTDDGYQLILTDTDSLKRNSTVKKYQRVILYPCEKSWYRKEGEDSVFLYLTIKDITVQFTLREDKYLLHHVYFKK